MRLQSVLVLGLGRVGALAAELLAEGGFQVTGADVRPGPSLNGVRRVCVEVADASALGDLMEGFDAVLSCLPYFLNMSVARLAHEKGLHYFDLTEDVPTTTYIRRLADGHDRVMAPQCGLAPGFIGIVGAHLASGFETIRSVRLRVGALPQNPTGLLGYAFNWSPEGVVNEYLNDCEVIEEGILKSVSAMEWLETVYIDGVKLEAFTTSGGLGTMCETFLGRVDNLDYKTMRYPGHVQLMNFFFHELLMRERRDLAGEILANAKPPVEDDVVYVHAAAEGQAEGRLSRREFVRAYRPRHLAGRMRTAIAWTTSAAAAAVIELTAAGRLGSGGFLKQEDIPFDTFAQTRTGSLFLSS
jgi:saccharopine dehydrogenase-like NADP-dependent oxidoreductase